MVREFREFIKRGNFLDLAVGFVMGVAVSGVITALVNFLLVAVALFLIVKADNRMQRTSPEEPEPEAEPDDVVLLREIRDALQAQRAGAPPAAARDPGPPPAT